MRLNENEKKIAITWAVSMLVLTLVTGIAGLVIHTLQGNEFLMMYNKARGETSDASARQLHPSY